MVSAQAKVLLDDEIHIQSYQHGQYPLTVLDSHETALKCPKWAGFRMEQAYWSVMPKICRREHISEAEFVLLAERSRRDLPSAAAVRLGILEYLCRQFEALPAPPTSVILHVLVVDDIAMNRDLAASFLRAVGHKVTCVEGGKEALTAIHTTDFNVVLMDVRMPKMNGLDATRHIRSLGGTRGSVPIVALTALAFAEQVADCREAGMDDHLAKPFSPDTLLAVVSRAASTGTRHVECLVPENEPACGREITTTRTIGSKPSIFDQMAFERSVSYLSPELVAPYIQNITTRAEALLLMLHEPDAFASFKEELAESAHSLVGSASMFGFEYFANIGGRFVQALESDTAEAPALGRDLSAALKATLREIYSRTPGGPSMFPPVCLAGRDGVTGSDSDPAV
jgi:CheY-like chemotaxis protein